MRFLDASTLRTVVKICSALLVCFSAKNLYRVAFVLLRFHNALRFDENLFDKQVFRFSARCVFLEVGGCRLEFGDSSLEIAGWSWRLEVERAFFF